MGLASFSYQQEQNVYADPIEKRRVDPWAVPVDCTKEATLEDIFWIKSESIGIAALEAREDGAQLTDIVRYRSAYRKQGRFSLSDLIYNGKVYRVIRNKVYVRPVQDLH